MAAGGRCGGLLRHGNGGWRLAAGAGLRSQPSAAIRLAPITVPILCFGPVCLLVSPLLRLTLRVLCARWVLSPHFLFRGSEHTCLRNFDVSRLWILFSIAGTLSCFLVSRPIMTLLLV